jgi:hypothetical protein
MGLGKKIGAENIFYSVHSAVETILAREAQAYNSVHEVQNNR